MKLGGRAQPMAEHDTTTLFEGHIILQSCHLGQQAQQEEAFAPGAPASRIADMSYGNARYCDQPMDWRTRLVGLGGTASLFAIMLAAALFTWKVAQAPIMSTTQPLTVIELAPLATPPEPVREVALGPQQVEKQEEWPEEKPDVSVPPPLVRLVDPSLSVAQTREPVIEVVDPGPPVPETTAQKSIVAPVTADRASNSAQPNWEGQILAHLQRFRRYPARARAARQHGTVLVRFVMNRAGMVLSSKIAQKSGSFDLDQAALETLQRAQPLPGIPKEKPDPLELTVPVEFQLR